MLLPRRRITSLTILGLFTLTLYQLSTYWTGSHNLPVGIRHKLKPEDAKLTGETPSSNVPAADQPSSTLSEPRPPVPGAAESPQIETPSDQTTTRPEGGEVNRWDSGQHVFAGKKFVAKYPVKLVQELPKGAPLSLPKLQYDFEEEEEGAKATRIERLDAVKKSFARSWGAYKEHAWMKDELKPKSGGSQESFGGWGATLVDTLDTLWIMGMKDEFEEAVAAAKKISFYNSTSHQLNVFETTIRYLGGFLGAYDISEGKYPELLEKATEIGELLYCAFDTPNRMPSTRWSWREALNGADQQASPHTIVAEVGSLTLEFTRLSQITGDPKYYDAVDRIMREFQKAQSQTRLPGLWPTIVNSKHLTFKDTGFTLSGMADSLYEYLPKEHLLLGGRSEVVDYKAMYKYAITAAMNHIFFQPMVPDGADILFPGDTTVSSSEGEPINAHFKANAQHLGCYAGGMVGMGSKLFDQPEHLNMARKLVDGCIWAYETMPTGIMPEFSEMIPCNMNSDCKWNQTLWEERLKEKAPSIDNLEGDSKKRPVERVMENLRLRPGFIAFRDRRYILRPEAIESVFIHYRLTGAKDLPEKAWKMFTAIENATRTDIANSAVMDVTIEGGNSSSRIAWRVFGWRRH
ncbi:uncharacterized protein KY384_003017 [Bacidia gigantensis]|uniref:uncharacterized protein n=1 Tax=Bacidia gigantensis TaxID=2732470 RepID=UPI001D03DDF0|nr:uncharacterized protein KY384_003017 [Bacidia gigantensis]KAG8531388.1 hypothetical protein KY384_003017 [Bacidia gigantensis]